MVSPENSHSQWQIAVFPDPKPQILKKPLSLRKTSPQVSNEKKIKILFRHRSMEMGGVEKVMLSLMHNLDPEKFEISVLLNINQGELRDEFPKHIRKVFLADGKEDLSTNSIIQKIQLFNRKRKLDWFRKNPTVVDKKILKEEFDIEVAMTYNDFEAVLHSSNKRSKKLGWFHSEIQLPKLQPLVPKILEHFPKFDYMVYCSERIQQLMHEHYPALAYPQEKVIINAIPIEEIKRKATENPSPFAKNDLPTFVSIGRLHTRKGYHKLIVAHQKLIQEGFQHQIIVLGDGEERQNLQNQINNSGVQKTFLLAGNQMNPYPYVQHSDFFILPSESEAWPLVIAEALILQKPIIATNVGDVGMVIKDGETGILIDYHTEEMYHAMKLFLTQPELVQHIKSNLRTIEQQFDNQKIFNEVENLMLTLVHQ